MPFATVYEEEVPAVEETTENEKPETPETEEVLENQPNIPVSQDHYG